VLELDTTADSLVQWHDNADNYYGKTICYQQNYAWVLTHDGWQELSGQIAGPGQMLNILHIFENIDDIYVDAKGDIWIMDKTLGIYKLNSEEMGQFNPAFNLFIRNIANNTGLNYNIEDLVLDYSKNNISIRMAAPNYLKDKSTQYQYRIEGLKDNWSQWSSSNIIEIHFLPAGSYNIQIRARNLLGKMSPVHEINVQIKKPFWQTRLFIVLMAISFLTLVYFVIKLRERKLRHDKKVLEQKVQERTLKIEKQKKEIEQQNKEIKDSIVYAKKIQTALLPTQEIFIKTFAGYFILFRPRDIVSGDFYWAHTFGKKTLIIAADCTGHGVPGAFMSMLGISFLNEIVNNQKMCNAGAILDQLRGYVVKSLKQGHSVSDTNDGMDLTLIIYDKYQKVIEFAGAYNPVYHVRSANKPPLMEVSPENVMESDGYRLTSLNGDKMPIGFSDFIHQQFNSLTIPIETGDALYMFSDGYADQFGGPKNKRFLSRNVKKKLLEIQASSMNNQKLILENTLDEWNFRKEQIDDILFLGLKF
jgi:serine phosphatase RsbU (regulator of sigma subunit)